VERSVHELPLSQPWGDGVKYKHPRDSVVRPVPHGFRDRMPLVTAVLGLPLVRVFAMLLLRVDLASSGVRHVNLRVGNF